MRRFHKPLAIIAITLLSLLQIPLMAQDGGTFFKPSPPNYEVKRALEIESLFPMFFYGGYHLGVGYRMDKFRVRVSVINGGTYDAEPAGVNNSSPQFKRY